jgi:hypothetical protein
LDILNALRIIKGDVKLDKEVMINDLENVKSKFPEAWIDVNYGTPVIVFIQTQDMQETYKIYREVMMVSVTKKRKNKYGLF